MLEVFEVVQDNSAVFAGLLLKRISIYWAVLTIGFNSSAPLCSECLPRSTSVSLRAEFTLSRPRQFVGLLCCSLAVDRFAFQGLTLRSSVCFPSYLSRINNSTETRSWLSDITAAAHNTIPFNQLCFQFCLVTTYGTLQQNDSPVNSKNYFPMDDNFRKTDFKWQTSSVQTFCFHAELLPARAATVEEHDVNVTGGNLSAQSKGWISLVSLHFWSSKCCI